MRLTATRLLVAALGGLVLAAVGDVLVDEGGPARTPRPQAERTAARALRAAGVGGVLLFAGEDCGVRAVRLPSLRPAAAPGVRSCSFSLSRDGRLAVGRASWQPRGPFLASCRAGAVELSAQGGAALPFARLYRFRGCAPAWRPDGRLTYVRDAAIVELAPRCGSSGAFCRRVLFSPGRLARILGARRPGLVAVRELVWLAPDAFAAVVVRSTGETALALVDEGVLAALAPLGLEPLSDLGASPRGTYVSLRLARSLLVFDRRARRIPLLAGVGRVRAVAWSRDERWAAVATDDGVYLSRPGARARERVRLPIVARDLAWREGRWNSLRG